MIFRGLLIEQRQRIKWVMFDLNGATEAYYDWKGKFIEVHRILKACYHEQLEHDVLVLLCLIVLFIFSALSLRFLESYEQRIEERS